MDHQDFKTVVLRKNNQKSNNTNNTNNVKPKSPPKEDGLVVIPKTFTKEFGNKLTAARLEKNMKRKDLSLKLNMKESVIADIENGKYLYDGNIVHKLKKLFPNM
jgi:ribosome-binding protein aMBF1 (putative translation factor)